MPAHCSKPTSHSYFVVMCDFGRKGREAIVDPEITRSGVVSRLRSGEYGQHINFIHHVEDGCADDVTNEMFDEAWPHDALREREGV